MVKDTILRFEINNDSFKDGNLFLYDGDKRCFYSITPEMFLHVQNEKIERLKREYEEKERSMKAEVENSKKEVEELRKRYDEFLKSYQESNAKLLAMVENFIKVYGGNK